MRRTHSHLTRWEPTQTPLPPSWPHLLNELEQETRGLPRSPQAYALNVRYELATVGDLLQIWGLPWPVVGAGYLLSYEDMLLQKQEIDDLVEIQEHKREALHYLRCIEDDDLFTLLHPPYKDPGALLIALAVYTAALKKHAQQKLQGQRYRPEEYAQIENVGRTILHISKRLGMWDFKRQTEDLIEAICNTERYVEDGQEYRHILKKDAARLDEIQRLLSRFYTETTGDEIHIGWVACGIAGLKRRQQDAYTTATTQKSELTGTDLVTFDIAVPRVKDCYAAFGVISQLGYIQDRVSDQIANPKPNGYSHIALNLILNPHHPLFRGIGWLQERSCSCLLQIATEVMQTIMHYGCLYPACYQIYAQSDARVEEEGDSKQFWQSSEGRVFTSMREDIQRSSSPSREPAKPIVVYDKNRAFVALPKGATALDFAYEIDIELGEKAAEAFVNNRKVELKRVLDAGDIVEIRTARETLVQEHWLEEPYAITPKARRHIKELLKRIHLERRGFDLIREGLERRRYTLPLEDLDEQIRQLVKEHKLGTRKSYLEQVSEKDEGYYSVEWATRHIIAAITARNTTSISDEPNWIPIQLAADSNPYRPLRLCATCEPSYVRHKEIVGYARRSADDLIVHSIHCPRIESIKQEHSSFMHTLTWRYDPALIKIGFLVVAQDRRGLVLDITRRLRKHQCVLLAIRADAILKFKKAEIRFTIETHDLHEALNIREEIKSIITVKYAEFDPTTTTSSMYNQLEHLQKGQKESYIAVQEIESDLEQRAPILRNPFDISRPASAGMFFGRSEEVKVLQRELCEGERGRAILLYGPRRSGKSSLCKNFLNNYVRTPCCTVFVSLQGASSQKEAEILEQIAEQIRTAFQEQHQLCGPSWQDLPDRDPEKRFKNLIEAYLTQRAPLRLLLTLDEFGGAFQAFEAGILQLRFFTYWRELISEVPQLSLILVIPSSAHRLINQGPLSNAFSFAQPLPLAYLDHKSAERLLVDPLREQYIALYPGVAVKAIELTGGNPYYMTLLGQQLIIQLNREPQKQLITEEDLQEIVEYIISTNSPQNFLFYREELQSKDEQKMLEAIVELTSHSNQPSISRKKLMAQLKLSENVIAAILHRLRSGLIVKEYEGNSVNPYYTFSIALVWHWMKRNRWFFTA
jgi:(p)ppGpp synthase/HD superfamily hydrolase